MRHSTLVAVLLVSMGLAPGQNLILKNSGENSTLLELYTSEGCSSCPPAEAWLSRLKNSADLWKTIFPVAFHVDYWDNLGWPDRFAVAAYTQRQRDYAARLGQDSVYTPEFVAAGREWRGWFKGTELNAETRTSGELTLHVSSDRAHTSVSYRPVDTAHSAGDVVNVALLGANILSDVGSGENGGRQLRHDFIVLNFRSKPVPQGEPAQAEFDGLFANAKDPASAVVAWVSAKDGTIAQVVGGWLPNQGPPTAR